MLQCTHVIRPEVFILVENSSFLEMFAPYFNSDFSSWPGFLTEHIYIYMHPMLNWAQKGRKCVFNEQQSWGGGCAHERFPKYSSSAKQLFLGLDLEKPSPSHESYNVISSVTSPCQMSKKMSKKRKTYEERRRFKESWETKAKYKWPFDANQNADVTRDETKSPDWKLTWCQFTK